MRDSRKYRVVNLSGDTWQVEEDSGRVSPLGWPVWEFRYQGSLSDCEAWIRLTEAGYM